MTRSAGTMRMMALAAALGLAAPVAAQQRSPSEDLLIAVRDGEGNRIQALVEAHGASAINQRGFTGWTPLTLATKQRNLPYVQFLLVKRADPNLATRDGDPALVIAAQQRWNEGAAELLLAGAQVDAANRAGETALIIAVHSRNLMLIRRLMEAGANPDKTDRAAGMSAREYARRDNRVRDVLRLIETVKPTVKKR